MAKPKLALIPAAQGSKLFSVLPSSGVGDFDFSRVGEATRINSQGLIETVDDGQSRLNYPMIDGKVVGCPHHILEPQRTNLVTQSENFASGWTLDDATIVSNSTTSPDGNLNATLFKGNTNSSRHNLVTSGAASNTGALSVFAKAKELKYVQIASANTTNQYVNFDVENGIVGTVGSSFSNAKIEAIGSDGWYRCSVVSNNQFNSFYINLVSGLNSSWNESWVMPNNTDGLYIWGAQLEQGSYPTSYIPTNGSTVTRNAETANGAGDASTFNDSEGVLMAEISALADISSLRTITIGDNSSSNAVSIRIDNANQIVAYVNVGGANQCSITASVPTSLFNKCLIKYKANDFSAWVNGFKIGVDTSGIVFPNGTLDRLNFDIGYTSTSPFYGNTKQIQYYDSALTDSELETLTSWTSFTDMAQAQQYSIK